MRIKNTSSSHSIQNPNGKKTVLFYHYTSPTVTTTTPRSDKHCKFESDIKDLKDIMVMSTRAKIWSNPIPFLKEIPDADLIVLVIHERPRALQGSDSEFAVLYGSIVDTKRASDFLIVINTDIPECQEEKSFLSTFKKNLRLLKDIYTVRQLEQNVVKIFSENISKEKYKELHLAIQNAQDSEKYETFKTLYNQSATDPPLNYSNLHKKHPRYSNTFVDNGNTQTNQYVWNNNYNSSGNDYHDQSGNVNYSEESKLPIETLSFVTNDDDNDDDDDDHSDNDDSKNSQTTPSTLTSSTIMSQSHTGVASQEIEWWNLWDKWSMAKQQVFLSEIYKPGYYLKHLNNQKSSAIYTLDERIVDSPLNVLILSPSRSCISSAISTLKSISNDCQVPSTVPNSSIKKIGGMTRHSLFEYLCLLETDLLIKSGNHTEIVKLIAGQKEIHGTSTAHVTMITLPFNAEDDMIENIRVVVNILERNSLMYFVAVTVTDMASTKSIRIEQLFSELDIPEKNRLVMREYGIDNESARSIHEEGLKCFFKMLLAAEWNIHQYYHLGKKRELHSNTDTVKDTYSLLSISNLVFPLLLLIPILLLLVFPALQSN